ncbi:Fic family protein [Tessaracoccus sp. OS52]|uniref:Fic family protein n=1 Tax=Tessaracoccus sp. OS52 TaxID=2886691 RepID=UPI001D123EAD|nr:Fic family protein [Tessaracoccus sp. OS52]
MDIELFQNSPTGDLVSISGSHRDGTSWTHQAFLPNPLPASDPPLSGRTYRRVAEARASLAGLDATARHLPNPRLFRHSTLRLEAQSTAALEGTYEPLVRVLTADEHSLESSTLREVMNFLTVAEQAFSWAESGRSISVAMLCQLQGELMRGTAGEQQHSGLIRPIQVVIGRREGADLSDAPIRAARFVPPPPGADLEAMVRELLDWMAADHGPDLDPVVATALAHYQFETLHPFHDGNGRLGRLLVVTQLHTTGLLSEPSISVSPWFEARRGQYYDALLGVSTRGDWDTWIDFFSQGLTASADAAKARMLRLTEVQTALYQRIHDSPIRTANALRVVDLALARPTFTVAEAAAELGIKAAGTHKLIDSLVALDILRPFGDRTYNRRFHAPAVVDVLIAESTD